ncbi:hypothetical protein LXN57_08110 [Actinoplanes sp. TRM88002]|uniref:Uncharacterized protein n=1 Tax=Paractinoplanes hotanensis TaxID=2906497 RepID=A0ABT0XV92_9ACTN|nr:hypothetical protein [Actinoplanes hotanensis]
MRSVLLEFLPLDESRRQRHLVHAAYFVRFLAGDTVRERIRDTPPELENLIALLVPAEHRDEADFLLAGPRDREGRCCSAELVDHQWDRIVPATP